MPAKLVEHRYTSGVQFWMVECRDCNVILNSGHHYRAEYLVFAEACAKVHNRDNHPDQQLWGRRLYEGAP